MALTRADFWLQLAPLCQDFQADVQYDVSIPSMRRTHWVWCAVPMQTYCCKHRQDQRSGRRRTTVVRQLTETACIRQTRRWNRAEMEGSTIYAMGIGQADKVRAIVGAVARV